MLAILLLVIGSGFKSFNQFPTVAMRLKRCNLPPIGTFYCRIRYYRTKLDASQGFNGWSGKKGTVIFY
jgi:hypothetical protein